MYIYEFLNLDILDLNQLICWMKTSSFHNFDMLGRQFGVVPKCVSRCEILSSDAGCPQHWFHVGVSIVMGVPPMDGLYGTYPLKWMIWGYPSSGNRNVPMESFPFSSMVFTAVNFGHVWFCRWWMLMHVAASPVHRNKPTLWHGLQPYCGPGLVVYPARMQHVCPRS